MLFIPEIVSYLTVLIELLRAVVVSLKQKLGMFLFLKNPIFLAIKQLVTDNVLC